MKYEPVGSEDLARIQQLQLAKRGIADKVLELEHHKINLLASDKRVQSEWDTIFSRIAEERGIPPEAVFDVNPRTGEVHVSQTSSPTPPPDTEPAGAKEETAEPAPEA